MIKNINAVVDAAEDLRARAHGEDWNVRQAVHALRRVGGKGAVDDEAGRAVLGVREVVFGWEAGDVGGWETRAVFVDLVAFADVGVGSEAIGEGVAWFPV